MVGAVFGFFGVTLGAFGAHGLRDKLEPRMLEVFQTGVHYQMIHALALLFLGVATSPAIQGSTDTVGYLFTAGIVIFSGSLYALATTNIKMFGAITPIGGLAFLAGWATLAYLSWKSA
jgi:uncharacterized membrane protein YgdD (TMEM256/DUF423 family)